MNLGNLKINENGIHVGRVNTLQMSAVIGLRAVNSKHERAPAFDIMGLAADKRSWIKMGAVWEFASNSTGEIFYSGRIDDPSMDKALEIAIFKQDDGSMNVTWRRAKSKKSIPSINDNADDLPPMDNEEKSSNDDRADQWGESTAPQDDKVAA